MPEASTRAVAGKVHFQSGAGLTEAAVLIFAVIVDARKAAANKGLGRKQVQFTFVAVVRASAKAMLKPLVIVIALVIDSLRLEM